MKGSKNAAISLDEQMVLEDKLTLSSQFPLLYSSPFSLQLVH